MYVQVKGGFFIAIFKWQCLISFIAKHIMLDKTCLHFIIWAIEIINF